jgi:hypothetical protein
MKLQNAFITALACTAIIFAAGTNQGGSGQGGTGGTGQGGQGQGTTNKAMMITGTIETVDTLDSLITLKPDTGTSVDTIYFNSMTKVGKQVMKSTSLKKGEKVKVHYRMMNGKKVAFEIVPMSKTKAKQGGTTGGTGGAGQSGQGQGGQSGQGGSGY